MKRFILSMLLILAASLAFGQVNTANLLDESKQGFYGETSITGQYQAGNKDLYSIKPNLTVGYKDSVKHLFLNASLAQVKSEDVIWAKEEFAHLRSIFKLEHTFIEAFAQWESNASWRLESRSLLGGGLRLQQPNTAIGAGLMYESEKVFDEETTSQMRISSYLNTQVELGQVHISEVIYCQPSLMDLTDYRILSDLRINAAISESLSLVTTFRWRHDSDPPTLVGPNDILIKQGASFNF